MLFKSWVRGYDDPLAGVDASGACTACVQHTWTPTDRFVDWSAAQVLPAPPGTDSADAGMSHPATIGAEHDQDIMVCLDRAWSRVKR